MSQELQNELARLLPFKSVPSFARRIEEIQRQLDPSEGISQADAEARDAGQDANIAALEDEIDTKADASLGATQVTWFLGSSAQSDDNDGLSENSPMATPEAVFARMDFNLANRIILLSNIQLTQDVRLPNRSIGLDIESANGEFNRFEFSGIGRLVFNGGLDLRFIDVQILNNREDGSPAVDAQMANAIRIINSELNYTQAAVDAAAGEMFRIGAFTNLHRQNTVTATRAIGRVMSERTDPDFADRAAVTV